MKVFESFTFLGTNQYSMSTTTSTDRKMPTELSNLLSCDWDDIYKQTYLKSTSQIIKSSRSIHPSSTAATTSRSTTTTTTTTTSAVRDHPQPFEESVYYDHSGFHDHPIYQPPQRPTTSVIQLWVSDDTSVETLQDTLSWFFEQMEQSRSRSRGSSHHRTADNNDGGMANVLQQSFDQSVNHHHHHSPIPTHIENVTKWVQSLISVPRQSWTQHLKTEEEKDAKTNKIQTYPICPICSKRDMTIVRQMPCCFQSICHECLVHWLTEKEIPVCCFCRRQLEICDPFFCYQ